jgi:hypothetical protein
VIDVADGNIPDEMKQPVHTMHIIKSEHCAATANNSQRSSFGSMPKPPMGLMKTPRYSAVHVVVVALQCCICSYCNRNNT